VAQARPITQHSSIRTAGNALAALVRKLPHAGLSQAKALHTALGLSLTIGLFLAMLLIWGFAELADEVLEGDTAAFDRAILAWIGSHHTGWLDRSAIELTALGSAVVLLVIGLALSVLLWHLGKQRYVALIWLASTGSLVLNQTLKAAFGRSRPDVFEWLVDVGNLSFPSGHAMNSMVFYTVAAYSVGHVVGPGAARTWTYGLAALLIGMIGFTRMYLGVHYPSDVLAGFAVGYAWAILCAILTEAWARRAAGGSKG
jgi:membrane-associated phospholipid phosphatase